MPRIDGRTRVDAGELNVTLRALATLATHATDEAIIFRRRPDDVRAEFELPRRRFFRLCAAAEEIGRLSREAAGERGVVEYRIPRRGVPTVALLAAKSAHGRTARAAKSAHGRTARDFPLLTDQDDHHHHQGERASGSQIRKACALDRAAGRIPDEARYQAMSRADIWDHIAAQERAERETAAAQEPTPVPPAPVPGLTAADRARIAAIAVERRRGKLRELLADTSVCARIGPAQVAEWRAELDRLDVEGEPES